MTRARQPQPFAVNPGWGLLIGDLGIEPANVLRRAELPGDLFSRGPTRISTAEYFALWSGLEEEADDPDLPIRIGEVIRAEVFDPPLFAGLCSANLNAAAERISRHKRLIGTVRLRVECSEAETTLTYDWPASDVPPRLLVAAELVFWVAFARLGTRTRIAPRRLEMPDPPPDGGAYRAYLGCAIEQGVRRSVSFSAKDAARPFLTANEGMWRFFEPELRRRLSELDDDASTADRVRAALLEFLPAGTATVERVARELAISTRTLQRRLRDENTTFQATLDATREELARHYLSNSRVPASEISFLLGYEDPNSFYRAFHEWTGLTPTRARAASL